MKIRLIATDLDRTMLNMEGMPSERTLRAVHLCHEKGILFVPITGRQYDCGQWIRENPDIPYVIISNGSRCFDNRTGETISLSCLGREPALRVLDILQDVPCCRRVFGNKVVYSDRVVCRYSERPADADDLYAIVRDPATEIEKIDVNFDDIELRSRMWKLVEAVPETKVSAAWPFNMEVNSPDGDKGSGLLRLAKLLGIPREETLSFGDGSNDIPMIIAAGTGVAMENGVDEIRAVGDIIAPPHWADGEAQVIEALALGIENEWTIPEAFRR